MLAKILSNTVVGIEAYAIEVEVDISNGLPAFNIVGLPDAACRESSDRVRAALKNSGIQFPARKITVNLAPASLKKEGAAFDLAIAVGILVANENLEAEIVQGKVFCGELSLDGRLRAIAGVLPRAAKLAQEKRSVDLFIPYANGDEASWAKNISIYPVESLAQLIRHLKGEDKIRPYPVKDFDKLGSLPERQPYPFDFSEIRGQAHAKRGLEIAASGGHNVLMIGPPGSGKTMLAKRIPSILSGMSFEEAMESTKIHSVAGLLPKQSSLLTERPFRDPHHTISHVAMVGGGTYPKPGEVSLAHQGVLFLDEVAEFRRDVLEVLRQPLEDGKVTISRASSAMTLPARFMLVGAMNPCPCGYFTDPKKECTCSPIQIRQYISKISGPLLDRIDIQLEVPRLKAPDIMEKQSSEPSAEMRKRVEAARHKQRKRYQGKKILCNAELTPRELGVVCQVSAEGEELLKMAIQELGFSARAYHKCLKVSRTIADMEGSESIEVRHVSEAIHYRTLDRLSGII